MIRIKTRDVNGKRADHYFYTDAEVHEWAQTLTEEDEVLSVAEDGACLYSALSSDRALTAEDLTGFFG